MPKYQYRCKECDKTYESIRSIEQRDSEMLCSDDGAICARLFSVPSRVWAPTRNQ